MIDEVTEFIRRRFPTDESWVSGNCLWFSFILQKRFPGGEIYYLPISGHFIYKYSNKYYDWRGEYKLSDEVLISLNSLYYSDKIWYDRLIENCLN